MFCGRTLNDDIKAIGGSGVKKTCQAYFKKLIAVVSTLLRNVKIQLSSEDTLAKVIKGGVSYHSPKISRPC